MEIRLFFVPLRPNKIFQQQNKNEDKIINHADSIVDVDMCRRNCTIRKCIKWL